MSLAINERPVSSKVLAATALIALAVAAWAFVLLRQLRTGPVQQHIHAGQEYVQQGQARLAEAEWKEAVRLQPSSSDAWEHLGELYSATGKWAEAVVAFRKLIQVNPSRAAAHSRLALALMRFGDEKGALQESELELKRNPEDGTALAIASLMLSATGELQRESEYLGRLVKIEPKDAGILTLYAENLTF